MRFFIGFLFLFVASWIACAAAVSDVSKEEVKSVIDKIQEKISSVTDKPIVQKVMVYGNVLSFSATAVKFTVELIQSLMGGPKESKELVFMREQFAIINTKLDALDYDFADVKNAIDWSVVKVNIGEYERSIRSLETIYENYMNAPPQASAFFQDIFSKAFIRTYNDAAEKIYAAMAKKSVFQDNLFDVAKKQLKNHRQEIGKFVGYILRIINRGVTLEHAHLLVLGKKERQQELMQEWQERYTALEKVAIAKDKEIVAAWETQFKVDSDEFAVRNAHLNNRQMTEQLFGFLSAKYPWRWWFTLVYTFTNHNNKDRFFENCGHSFVKYNVGNKVVIVNGLEANYPRKSNPAWFLNSVPLLLMDVGPYEEVAKKLYQRSASGCHLYAFKGVIETKADIAFLAPAGRMFRKQVKIHRLFHNKLKGYEMLLLV